MAVPGVVHVKILPPVLVHEGQDREAMSDLVRKRMLESLQMAPRGTCRPLNMSEWVYCGATLVMSAVVCTGILWGIYEAVKHRFAEGWSVQEVAIWSAAITVGGTIVSFVYCVHIQRWAYQFWKRSRANAKTSTKKRH